MKFGICTGPDALGEPARGLELLAEAGADYVEWGVISVMADEAQFEKLRQVTANAPIRPETFCVFIPAAHRVTGPNVNMGAALDYCGEAMRRMAAIGGQAVVLGSSAARRVPEGFDSAVAYRQFVEFCRELGPRAGAAGMMVAIEPLNFNEDNLINTVAQGSAFVDEVAHPNIQLLADFHHMQVNEEPLESVAAANGRLQHTHVADIDRFAPGFAPTGEADFVGFYRELRKAGYDNRCSFEGQLSDLATQAKPLLNHMRRRYQESGNA
jgi:sugar phosphate isomerase/epimerase